MKIKSLIIIMTIFIGGTIGYTISDLGFDKSLTKSLFRQQDLIEVTPELSNIFTSGVAPKSLLAGELLEFVNTGQAGVSGRGSLGSDIRFWAGDTFANRASAPFRVDQDGNVTMTSATLSGTIDIGGSDATSFHVDVDGNMWLGAATLAAAPFSVSNNGDVIADDIIINSLTWGRLTGFTSFESLDGFATKGIGSSAYAVGFLGARVRTGATNGNYAVLYANPVIQTGTLSLASFKNPLIQITTRVADVDFAEAFLGITNVAGWPLDNAVNDNYVGFHLKNSIGYAVSRRAGQATTSTQITTTIGDYHSYRFVITAPGSGQITSVLFYLDGSLVATHSNQSLLPALLEEADLFMGVKNWNNGGQQELHLINLLYIQDFD